MTEDIVPHPSVRQSIVNHKTKYLSRYSSCYIVNCAQRCAQRPVWKTVFCRENHSYRTQSVKSHLIISMSSTQIIGEWLSPILFSIFLRKLYCFRVISPRLSVNLCNLINIYKSYKKFLIIIVCTEAAQIVCAPISSGGRGLTIKNIWWTEEDFCHLKCISTVIHMGWSS